MGGMGGLVDQEGQRVAISRHTRSTILDLSQETSPLKSPALGPTCLIERILPTYPNYSAN